MRENVRRIIKDEVIPAEARVDSDAAEIDEDDYWRIARKVQAAGMWCMGSPTAMAADSACSRCEC